jgi:hypothetical protein
VALPTYAIDPAKNAATISRMFAIHTAQFQASAVLHLACALASKSKKPKLI